MAVYCHTGPWCYSGGRYRSSRAGPAARDGRPPGAAPAAESGMQVPEGRRSRRPGRTAWSEWAARGGAAPAVPAGAGSRPVAVQLPLPAIVVRGVDAHGAAGGPHVAQWGWRLAARLRHVTANRPDESRRGSAVRCRGRLVGIPSGVQTMVREPRSCDDSPCWTEPSAGASARAMPEQGRPNR
jgi:hypothetical protein